MVQAIYWPNRTRVVSRRAARVTLQQERQRRRLFVSATIAMATVLVGCASAPSTSTGSTTTTSSRPPTPSIGSSSSAGPKEVTPDAPVPAQYQSLYSGLSAQLDGYQAAVTAMPSLDGSHSAPLVAGVELLEANANRGSALFNPGVLSDVSRDIDHFKAMGITGLTLGIKLPYLLSSYTGADAARYLSFYEDVASMIRAQRMTIDVELSAAFCGTAYDSCSYNFPDTVAGFAAITAQQARIVIQNIHPNYVTLISEDTTDAALTKDPTLDTVTGATQFVSTTLQAIGPHPGVAVGAGAATWQPPAFNQALLKLPIDYLDLHIYPIGPTEVANLVADSEMAHAAHIPLVADEAWLFKTLAPKGEFTSTAVYRLDNFSFFSPVDTRFAAITQEWARKAGVSYDSAFWSFQMFGYVTWTPALDTASYPQLSFTSDLAAIQAMVAGDITPAGHAWVATVDAGGRRTDHP